VIENLSVELVAQDNYVLADARKHLLIGVSGTPDPGFAHEVEADLVDHCGTLTL
jgi:hypothetical protein